MTAVTEQIHDIGRRRAWVIWLVALSVYVLAIFNRSSLGVAGLLATERFGITATQLSFFTVLQLVVYAGLQVPIGVLLDRYGSRVLLLGGLALMTLGQLLFAFATTFRAGRAGAGARRGRRRGDLRQRDPAGDAVVPGPSGADDHPADRSGRPARGDRGRGAAGPRPAPARLDASSFALASTLGLVGMVRSSCSWSRTRRTRASGSVRIKMRALARSCAWSGATPARASGCGRTSRRSSARRSSRCCGAIRSW